VREADDLTNLPVPHVMKSGSLNLLEPSGSQRPSYRTPLPLPVRSDLMCSQLHILMSWQSLWCPATQISSISEIHYVRCFYASRRK